MRRTSCLHRVTYCCLKRVFNETKHNGLLSLVKRQKAYSCMLIKANNFWDKPTIFALKRSQESHFYNTVQHHKKIQMEASSLYCAMFSFSWSKYNIKHTHWRLGSSGDSSHQLAEVRKRHDSKPKQQLVGPQFITQQLTLLQWFLLHFQQWGNGSLQLDIEKLQALFTDNLLLSLVLSLCSTECYRPH